jgi:hypothetical protein
MCLACNTAISRRLFRCVVSPMSGNKTATPPVLHVKPALEALRNEPAVDFLNPVERTSCRQIFLPNRHAAMP